MIREESNLKIHWGKVLYILLVVAVIGMVILSRIIE